METPQTVESLSVQIYGDGADKEKMLAYKDKPFMKGYTTNPTLLREAGVENYEAFGREVLAAIPDKPISFEVFADEFDEMERQARLIHSWGGNVYVKIPITNTKGASAAPLIRELSSDGVQLNVTALLSPTQVETVARALSQETPSIVSVFAGRIADTGRDPMPIMREAKNALANHKSAQLLWASCREVFNIYEAEAVGADIITVPYSILDKLHEVGTDLEAFSLAGVRTFYEAAKASGYSL